ncbi:unnamed protein product [Gordionus sp. m RMFG-2023]
MQHVKGYCNKSPDFEILLEFFHEISKDPYIFKRYSIGTSPCSHCLHKLLKAFIEEFDQNRISLRQMCYLEKELCQFKDQISGLTQKIDAFIVENKNLACRNDTLTKSKAMMEKMCARVVAQLQKFVISQVDDSSDSKVELKFRVKKLMRAIIEIPVDEMDESEIILIWEKLVSTLINEAKSQAVNHQDKIFQLCNHIKNLSHDLDTTKDKLSETTKVIDATVNERIQLLIDKTLTYSKNVILLGHENESFKRKNGSLIQEISRLHEQINLLEIENKYKETLLNQAKWDIHSLKGNLVEMSKEKMDYNKNIENGKKMVKDLITDISNIVAQTASYLNAKFNHLQTVSTELTLKQTRLDKFINQMNLILTTLSANNLGKYDLKNNVKNVNELKKKAINGNDLVFYRKKYYNLNQRNCRNLPLMEVKCIDVWSKYLGKTFYFKYMRKLSLTPPIENYSRSSFLSRDITELKILLTRILMIILFNDDKINDFLAKFVS